LHTALCVVQEARKIMPPSETAATQAALSAPHAMKQIVLSEEVHALQTEGLRKFGTVSQLVHCTVKYLTAIFALVQINQPTRCNNSSSMSLDVYVQLNMFRTSSHP